MKTFFKKYSSQLAFWLIPPNLLLTGNMGTDTKDKRRMDRAKVAHEQEVIDAMPMREITPAVAPVVKDASHVFADGAFIWWKSVLNGLETAVTGISDTSTLTNVKQGRVYKPQFNYEPGLKASFGGYFNHDGWDITAEFTWIASEKQTVDVDRDSSKGLYSIYPVSVNGVYSTVPLSTSQTSWRQKFYVVDLELGRKFFISHALTLRPSLGAKLAWIKQTTETNYAFLLGTFPFTPSAPLGTPVPTNASFDCQQKMFGVGVRGGLDTVWYFTKNWGLFGDIAATALWSQFRGNAKEINQPGTFETFNTKETTRTITPVFEISAGLRYQVWFNDDRCQFYGQAGWEQQIWTNFNHIPNQNLTRTGDLTIQGLTAKFGFVF